MREGGAVWLTAAYETAAERRSPSRARPNGRGQWDRAEQSFRRAIELDRNRSGTYVDYADGLVVVLSAVRPRPRVGN